MSDKSDKGLENIAKELKELNRNLKYNTDAIKNIERRIR